MWIIPKNLNIYHYAQDMGGLILDSQELSDQLEQSVLWRSKPSQSKTWSLRLKRDSSIKHLFSQTLKPSIGNSFMEKWTSSVEASLVSHLAQPEEEKEAKIQDTCGHTLQMESNDWEDLPLFSSRMLKGLSQVNSREAIGEIEKELQFCSMSSESWRDWVIKQRLEYSQRVKLARHTKESEFSYLVSGMILGKKVLMRSTNSSSKINQLSNWATPRANKITPEKYETWKKRADKGQVATMPLGLQVEVEQHGQHQEDKTNTATNLQELRWATPMAGTKNHMGSSIEYYIRRQNIGKQVDLKGKLNPRWVEMLMGLPIGWTMPSCLNPVIIEQMNSDCLETE